MTSIKIIIDKINDLTEEYYDIQARWMNVWMKNGKTEPKEDEVEMVNRKKFLESIFDELGVKYSKWNF